MKMPGLREIIRLQFIVVITLVFTWVPANLVFADRDWRSEMLSQVNLIRKEAGVRALKLCKNLSIASQSYSEDMARQNFFSHSGKNGSTLTSRTKRAGYVASAGGTGFALGENIAKGQNNVNEVIKAWRNSKGHYRNMIEGNFSHVGFGRSKHENSLNTFFWVQNFGTGGNCSPK